MEKFNVRDLINVGLFTVLVMAFIFIGSMVGFIPVLMPFIGFCVGILSGPIYMLYATKINKPGMIVSQQILLGFIYALAGHGFWTIFTNAIGGIIGEVIFKRNNYKSVKDARLAFSFCNLGVIGNFLPIFFTRDAYLKGLIDSGYGAEFTEVMNRVLPNWSLIPIAILCMLGGYIGCTLGMKMLKKHFIKAGMVDEKEITI